MNTPVSISSACFSSEVLDEFQLDLVRMSGVCTESCGSNIMLVRID